MRGQRTGKNNGAKFRGLKIIILKNNEYDYSSNRKAASKIREFKDLLAKAKAEHAKTNECRIENRLEDEGIVNPPAERIDNVGENTMDNMQDRIDQLSPASTTLSLMHSELREILGAIHIVEQEGQKPEQQIMLL